jgi:hypothetical protein
MPRTPEAAVSPPPKKNPRPLRSQSMMQVFGSLLAERTVIALPRMFRSLFPVPVYVPSATVTTSPLAQASIAAWIVPYSPGTCRSVASAGYTIA